MRRWSYETFGSEQAFQFLVMATPDDISIGSEYIKLADEVRSRPEPTVCSAVPRCRQNSNPSSDAGTVRGGNRRV